MSFLEHSIYGNSVQLWLTVLGATTVLFLVLELVKTFIVRRLRTFVSKTSVRWDDIALGVVSRTRAYFLMAVAVYIGMQALSLPPQLSWVVRRVAFLIVLVQMTFWGSALITLWIEHYLREKADDGARATTVRAIGFLIRLVFFSLVFLWGLDNFGVNITTLITGLGVGGIAVALAVQNILGDLFASLTIVLDKPFVIGDSIVVDNFEGKIEHVGLKTTRVRSSTGEQLIFPNSNLLQSRIRNFKRMQERRAILAFGVTYETELEKLPQIAREVRRIIEAHSPTRFERAHFKGFSASSLDFEAVYWVLSADYNLFMDIQQSINIQLFAYLKEFGVDFAYPTQTLRLQRERLKGPVA